VQIENVLELKVTGLNLTVQSGQRKLFYVTDNAIQLVSLSIHMLTKSFLSAPRVAQQAGARLWLLGIVALLFLAQSATAQDWGLVWSDEFNGPAGSAPDPSIWKFETGNNNGWGNNELEYYCPPTNNLPPCSTANPNTYLDGTGNLVIQAIKTQSGTWTSGRMKTEGLESFQYGRIEARMKLPVGAGIWPAFWMLGTNIGTVNWPTCGEQDIMEWVPQYTPIRTSSTVHGPGYSGGNGIGSRFIFPNNGQVDNAFHTYGVIWSQDKMQFYRDDYTQPFFTVTPANIPAGTQWVYNHPFFILLNLAIGGGFPGNPDGTTPSPSLVLVDYVRVYQLKQSSAVAVASSNSPSVFGQPVTLTATLSPASATGTVQFVDGVTNLGSPATVNNGAAAMIVSSLSVGAHSITAVYSGDSNFSGSTSPALGQNVNQASSATAVTSNNPSSFGQTVTFTATVSAVPPGSGTPTGTVQFKDGINSLGSPVTLNSGTATFITSSLSIGTHNITAVYNGDASFMGSTSPLFAQTVNKDGSSPSVSSSANPSTSGQPVTFTAVVSTSMPSSGTPTGTVQFKDGVTNLGSPVTLSNGTAASSSISSLTVGAHKITAVYSGDAIFLGNTSPPLTQSVTSNGTTATTTTISNIVVLPNPTPGQKPGTVHLGQSITVTATVTTATGTPTGSVALLDNNGDQIGSSKDLTGIGNMQNVTFAPFEFGLGIHGIVARYFGDNTFQTSSSLPSLIEHTPKPR